MLLYPRTQTLHSNFDLGVRKSLLWYATMLYWAGELQNETTDSLAKCITLPSYLWLLMNWIAMLYNYTAYPLKS